MTSPISSIPTTRVSEQFIRQRLLNQVQYDQSELFRVQTQLNTGLRYQVPSEDPISALRVISLQRLLERKDQVMTNLATNQSYLNATDATLSSVSGLVAEARGVTLGVLGTTSTDAQRQAAVQQVRQTLQQLVDTGNQLFRGRYLFTGSETTQRPFSLLGASLVEYSGNERHLESYADIDQLFQTNMQGNEVFGVISEPVRGTADLNPVLTFDTRVADLRSGLGISDGSIRISDGTKSSTVDLSSAETIGDLAALIAANPPPGRQLLVDITPTRLVIQLDPVGGGALSIQEVGEGTVAEELGILREIGQASPIEGRDLDPIVRQTTRLDDCFGSRAVASVHSLGADNDIIVRATQRGEELPDGTALNGVTVRYIGDVAAGAEYVDYTPGVEIAIHIDPLRTEAQRVVEVINATPGLPFTAEVDPLDEVNGGDAVPQVTATGVTAYGSGGEFDKASGLQITNRDDSYTVSTAHAETVEDLLNALNGAGAGLLAEINQTRTGIDVRSRVSGCDFAIGENGGTTAAQLGLRTMTEQTRLEDFNHGRGVEDWPGYTGTAAEAVFVSAGGDNDLRFRSTAQSFDWNDFAISFVDTGGPLAVNYDPAAKSIVFEIDQGTTTANDVVGLVVNDPVLSADWEVELAETDGPTNTGKGLVGVGTVTTAGGDNSGTDFLITRADGVQIPIDIAGVETVGQLLDRINTHPLNTGISDGTGHVADSAGNMMSGDGPASLSTVTVPFPELNADLVVSANVPASGLDGTEVIFVGAPGGPLGAVHDPVGRTLTITYDNTPGAETTANDVVALFVGDPTFTVALDTTDAPGSLQARLAEFGNGIELVDSSVGAGTLTVTRDPMSHAAIDLGLVPDGAASATGTPSGGAQVLTGSDANPKETEGVLTALVRICQALSVNDVYEVQRAIEMLDSTTVNMNFARAELGARQQGLDILKSRLDTEDLELRQALSLEYDMPLEEAISELTARQATYEASLRSMAQILHTTLLDYL
jgi:flagellar hook-associated protein 3 FlgL